MTEESSTGMQAPGDARPPVSTLRWIFMNERELRAGWRLSIYAVLLVLIVGVLGVSAVYLGLLRPSQALSVPNAIAQEIILAAAAFGAALILRPFEHRPFGAYGLPARAAFRGHFWEGVVWGFVMIFAVMLLITAWGGFSFGRVALSGGAIPRYASVWGLVFLLTGFGEEFTFRGYTQFTLASGMGFWPAAILLSLGFGGLHLFNPGEGPAGALSVFVTAMFFCLTLRRTGSLWFAVGLHAAWDWSETFLFSVPNSGLVFPGHLLNSSLHGPKWLSGGTIGPEGSVMAFVVIGAAALLFSFVYRAPRAETGASAPVASGP